MFKRGQILIATRTQYYSCGATKIHMDAIVKAASDQVGDEIRVYLSKNREKRDDYTWVDCHDGRLKPATEEQVAMWHACVRSCCKKDWV